MRNYLSGIALGLLCIAGTAWGVQEEWRAVFIYPCEHEGKTHYLLYLNNERQVMFAKYETGLSTAGLHAELLGTEPATYTLGETLYKITLHRMASGPLYDRGVDLFIDLKPTHARAKIWATYAVGENARLDPEQAALLVGIKGKGPENAGAYNEIVGLLKKELKKGTEEQKPDVPSGGKEPENPGVFPPSGSETGSKGNTPPSGTSKGAADETAVRRLAQALQRLG
ncbi:MAG: hypothetical protein M1549_00270 [Candidatus Dependentiae bacterium]|nr:hypothetical protein [Candidatus Dependentiae bacterium]